MCSSSGTRIKIGLFEDEECSVYDASAEIDQYIKNENGYNVKLSYHLLKQTFPEGSCVASCTDENADDDGAGNQAETAEVCQNLYEAAGKCETSHGFVGGIAGYDGYGVQAKNEDLVCEFISTVRAGKYDQTGEIVVSGGRTSFSASRRTTGGQKFALTFFVIGSVGLAAYAFMLHQEITKGAKADLSEQGGALA